MGLYGQTCVDSARHWNQRLQIKYLVHLANAFMHCIYIYVYIYIHIHIFYTPTPTPTYTHTHIHIHIHICIDDHVVLNILDLLFLLEKYCLTASLPHWDGSKETLHVKTLTLPRVEIKMMKDQIQNSMTWYRLLIKVGIVVEHK